MVSLQVAVFCCCRYRFLFPQILTQNGETCASVPVNAEIHHQSAKLKRQVSVRLRALLTVLLSHSQNEKNINTMTGPIQSW